MARPYGPPGMGYSWMAPFDRSSLPRYPPLWPVNQTFPASSSTAVCVPPPPDGDVAAPRRDAVVGATREGLAGHEPEEHEHQRAFHGDRSLFSGRWAGARCGNCMSRTAVRGREASRLGSKWHPAPPSETLASRIGLHGIAAAASGLPRSPSLPVRLRGLPRRGGGGAVPEPDHLADRRYPDG